MNHPHDDLIVVGVILGCSALQVFVQKIPEKPYLLDVLKVVLTLIVILGGYEIIRPIIWNFPK